MDRHWTLVPITGEYWWYCTCGASSRSQSNLPPAGWGYKYVEIYKDDISFVKETVYCHACILDVDVEAGLAT